MNNKNELCNIHQTYYGFITLNPLNESTTEDQWKCFSKILMENNEKEKDEKDTHLHFFKIQENNFNWQVRVQLTSSKSEAETHIVLKLKNAFLASDIKNVEVAILLSLQYLNTNPPTGEYGGAFDDRIDYNIIRSNTFDVDSVLKPAGSMLLKWNDRNFQQL